MPEAQEGPQDALQGPLQAEKAFGPIRVRYVRQQADCADHPICITNYEMLEHFDEAQFGAIVLDESSILKSMDGKTRRKLVDMFRATPYRLACTATPFLGIGSEAYQAIRFGRRAVGIELKASYFRIAVKNLAEAERQFKTVDIFSFVAPQAEMVSA